MPTWSMDDITTPNAGIDIGREMVDVLSREIQADIDREILQQIFKGAVHRPSMYEKWRKCHRREDRGPDHFWGEVYPVLERLREL